MSCTGAGAVVGETGGGGSFGDRCGDYRPRIRLNHRTISYVLHVHTKGEWQQIAKDNRNLLIGRGTYVEKREPDDGWWEEDSTLPDLMVSRSRSTDEFQSSANPVYTSTLTSWSSSSSDVALTVVEAAGVVSATKS